jgi:hypothetical protein
VRRSRKPLKRANLATKNKNRVPEWFIPQP